MAAEPGTGFRRGFLYPFNSVGFIKEHPTITTYIIIPFLINVAVFSLVVYLGYGYFQEVVLSRLPHSDAWYWIFLNYFLLAFAVCVILAFVFFTFTVVGSLIAAPFNDLLSERTEEILAGEQAKEKESFSFAALVSNGRRNMVSQAKTVAMFVMGMLLLFMLNLLPVIGSVLYAVLSVLWVIFFLVIEYTGYVFLRKGVAFKEQRRLVYCHFTMMLGFGCAVFCMLAIPFLQFLSIPLGVVGGTRMLFDVDLLMADTQSVVAEEKRR